MRLTFLLAVAILATNLSGFCKIWQVTDSGLTFSPETLTIQDGDTVNFVLSPSHNAIVTGGFEVPFGGGMVLPAQLKVGIHFYGCTPHSHAGMKGTIIVQSRATAVTEKHFRTSILLYPNPSNGKFTFTINDWEVDNNSKIEIYNILGEVIFTSPMIGKHADIDLGVQLKGVYFLKIQNPKAMFTKEIIIQ